MILNPDYANHPAYGRLFGRPKLATRIIALRRWWGGCCVVLSNLKGISRKKYRAWIVSLLFRRPSVPVSEADSSLLLKDLLRDGAVAIRLKPVEMLAISAGAEPSVRKLEERRAQIEDGQRKHRDNTIGIPFGEAPEFYAEVRRILESHHILSAAARYLGYPVRYIRFRCGLLIFEPSDISFWRYPFKDMELPDPQTTYMHIDSRLGMLKCLVYLTHVTKGNGPFSYVIGTNHKMGLLEQIVRKANDICGLDGCGRETRELFWALPKALRKKAAFGFDLLNSTPESLSLLSRERQYTSEDGDLIFFDNATGVHRGGMLREGKRRVLQINLS